MALYKEGNKRAFTPLLKRGYLLIANTKESYYSQQHKATHKSSFGFSYMGGGKHVQKGKSKGQAN